MTRRHVRTVVLGWIVCMGSMSEARAIETFTGTTIAVADPHTGEWQRAITYDDIAKNALDKGAWIATQGYGNQWKVMDSGGPDGSAFVSLSS